MRGNLDEVLTVEPVRPLQTTFLRNEAFANVDQVHLDAALEATREDASLTLESSLQNVSNNPTHRLWCRDVKWQKDADMRFMQDSNPSRFPIS